MKLSTQEIRTVVAKVTDYLDSIGSGQIEIPHDFYWDIPAEQKYNVLSNPTEFTVGQLSDDLLEIQNLTAGKTPPVGYCLVWLGALLRAAGENARG